jgi:hypothetical protein
MGKGLLKALLWVTAKVEVGSLKCCVIQVDGLELDITLHKVKYVPELWVNLFSVNKALKNGHKLSNKGLSICLSK